MSSCRYPCVTPAADAIAASSTNHVSLPSFNSFRQSIDFSLDLAAMAPIFPDSFIDYQAPPQSAKTFDQMSPAEFAEITARFAQQLAADAYHTPADDAVLAGTGPIRGGTGRRSLQSLLMQPYPTGSSRGSSLTEFNLPPPLTAGLVDDFMSAMAWATPASHTVATSTSNPASPCANASPTGEVFPCGWHGCDVPIPFTSIAALTAHLLHRHIPRRRSQYPCLWQGCPRGHDNPFAKRHKLIAHLRAHTHERPFACPVCNRAFAREDSRDAHVKVHGEERNGPWVCGCNGGRVWQSWRGVRRHQAAKTCAGVVQLSTGLAIPGHPNMPKPASAGEWMCDDAMTIAEGHENGMTNHSM